MHAVSREVADLVEARADATADAVAEEFVRTHAGRLARFGASGVAHTRRDHRHHLGFLATCLRYGRPQAFAEYVAWCVRVLEPRHVDRSMLREALARLGTRLERDLGPERFAVVAPYLAMGLAACAAGREEAAPERLQGPAAVYLQALLAGDRQEALRVALSELDPSGDPLPVYRMVELAQKELGRLWERAEISVGEEHLGTVVTQFVLARLGERLESPAPTRGRALVTGAEGELHQVGAQMLADTLARDGWNVRFLGADTPNEAVLELVRKERPRLLALSVMMLPHVPRVEDLIRRVRETGPDAPRILVGGGILQQIPGLWRDLGADAGGGDLETARGVARQAPPAPDPGPRTLLVVDDEPVVRRLVARILGSHGWRVLEAGDLDEALARSAATRLDAAVLDVVLPGPHGPAVGERLRERQPGLPLIFISGMPPPADLPPDAPFLRKPFTVAGLAQTVERTTSRAPA